MAPKTSKTWEERMERDFVKDHLKEFARNPVKFQKKTRMDLNTNITQMKTITEEVLRAHEAPNACITMIGFTDLAQQLTNDVVSTIQRQVYRPRSTSGIVRKFMKEIQYQDFAKYLTGFKLKTAFVRELSIQVNNRLV